MKLLLRRTLHRFDLYPAVLLSGNHLVCTWYRDSFQKTVEPLVRIELTTSSLPRMCSTPELQRLIEFVSPYKTQRQIFERKTIRQPADATYSDFNRKKAVALNFERKTIRQPADATTALLSGRRGSNPRPTAWKAVALPTELLPHIII